MSSNLGQMVLELSANTARFQSDMGKFVSTAQQSADKAKKALESVAGAIGVGIGAGAFVEFVSGAIEAQDQALKLSQKIGVAVDSMAGLSSAAQKAGVDQAAFQVGMVKLADNAAKAANGVKDQAAAFKALGVNVLDAAGHLKSSDTLLGELADKFASYRDGATKTAAAVTIFGKAGADLIPLLNGGSAAIAHQVQLTRDLGAAYTEDGTKSAEKFKDTLSDLRLVSTGVGNQIANAMLPALNKLADAAIAFFTSDTWKSWLANISGAFSAVARNIDTIIAGVKLMGEIAAEYIGVRFVGAVVTATTKLIAMAAATAAANSAAAEMGMSFGVGVGASIKQIGYLNSVLGTVFAAVTGWQIGTYLYEQFSVVQKIANNTIAGFDALWTAIKAGAEGAVLEIQRFFFVMLDAIAGRMSDSLANMAANFSKLPDALGGGKLAAEFVALSTAIAPSGAHVADLDARIQTLTDDTKRNLKIIAGTWNEHGAAVTTAATATNALGDSAKTTMPNIAGLASASENAAKALAELNAAQKSALDLMDTLRGKIDPAAAATAEFDKGMRSLQKAMEDWAIAGGDVEVILQMWQEGEDLLRAALDKTNAALAKQGDVLGNFLDDIKKTNALIGLTDREKAVATAIQKVTDEYNKNTLAGIKNLQSLHAVTIGAAEAAAAAFDLAKKQADIDGFVSKFGDVSEFDKLKKGIEEVGEALDKAIGDGATAKAKELQRTLAGMKYAMQQGIVAGAKEGLQSLQSMTQEGSKSFRELQVAIDLTTIAEGVLAIIHQLSAGDVYSAIPRALAVAAAIAQLGVDVGNIGASSAQSAETVQKNQGTGSVLGDTAAKSESIAKATEITANATTQLVGLNRGMLTSLQALQSALGAAGNSLARGAGNVKFPGIGGNSAIGLDPITKGISNILFGGSKKVIDQGIIIAGGMLNDMLNNIVVGAYQTIKTSGGLFGGGGTKNNVVDISGEFNKQFGLVIKSIADTVRAGALALGLLPADVEAAMASYRVAATTISLSGLSAEDQQKALEAVFSKMFDGLAGAVVPFIGQFQKVGEGLGETLVRVATEVQVMQEGIKQLGLAVNEADPEKFAQISDALITASGGIDAFISGMQSFVTNFSSSSNQLLVSATALNSAFDQVGLSVPATRDEMWKLMQSLDATTEAGRAQIAALLRLSDTANAYYNQIDEFSATLGLNGTQSEFTKQLEAIKDAAAGLIKALTAAGASTATLDKVYAASVSKINELIAQLQESAQELAFSLGLTDQGSLDQINQEIARLTSSTEVASSSVSDFGKAITQVSHAATDAMNLLLGNLSPLNDEQKLQVALQGLRAGTATQEQVLNIGRSLFASSEAYNDLFKQVMAIGNHVSQGGASRGGGGGSNTTTVALSDEDRARLATLTAARDAMAAANTLNQYKTLAQQIEEIANAKGETFQQVIQEMGINMADLEKGLGLKDDQALADFMAQLQAQMDSAGNNTASIVAAIIDLPQQIFDAFDGKPISGTNIISMQTPDPMPVAPGTSGPPHIAPGNGHGASQNEFMRTVVSALSDIGPAIDRSVQSHMSRNLRFVN